MKINKKQILLVPIASIAFLISNGNTVAYGEETTNLISTEIRQGEETTTPNEEIKAPETTPNEEITTPETTPNEEIKDIETTPNEEIKDPEVTPNEEIKDPETTPNEEIKDPETTPNEEIKDPEVTPNEEIKDPEVPKVIVPKEIGDYKLEDYFSKVEWITRGGILSISVYPVLESPIVKNTTKAHIDNAFNLLKQAYESDSRWNNRTTSIYNQYTCHVSFAGADKVPWNLEPQRIVVGTWDMIITRCNPEIEDPTAVKPKPTEPVKPVEPVEEETITPETTPKEDPTSPPVVDEITPPVKEEEKISVEDIIWPPSGSLNPPTVNQEPQSAVNPLPPIAVKPIKPSSNETINSKNEENKKLVEQKKKMKTIMQIKKMLKNNDKMGAFKKFLQLKFKSKRK